MNYQKQKITKSVVADAKRADREYVIWDTNIAGFGLRVRPSGAKSFVFVYRTPGGRAGKVRRVTIRAATAEKAREAAKALAGQFHGGRDPAAERADEKQEALREKLAPTVAHVLDRFLTDHVDEKLKPKTALEYRRIVERILKPRIGGMKIAELAPKHVAEMNRRMRKTPTQAALAVRVLSSAMTFAEEWDLRPPGPNPARIRLKSARRRERLFSDIEVARLLAAIDALEAAGRVIPAVALGIRLLFATGCRAGEIIGLQWSNVNFEEEVLRWPDTKTGYLEKPMTDEARTLLEGAARVDGVEWVCPSAAFKQMRLETLEAGFERVMAAANVQAKENATLHLIRHWFASRTYSDKSIPLPHQMAIVGHTSASTALRYAHVRPEEVKEAARLASQRRAAAIGAAAKRGVAIGFGVGADD